MQLVRQIQFKPTKLLDDLCFRSKNLFNVATYVVRQRFFEDRHWIRHNDLWKLLKGHHNYKELEDIAGSHPPQHRGLHQLNNHKLFLVGSLSLV